MKKTHKTYFNWSSGKDASLALYHLQHNESFQVTQLLTSVNSSHNRISMHGVRRQLLEEQARSIGLPLTTIELSEEPGMAEYEEMMRKAVETLRDAGFTHSAFGDIFLEDLKNYREEQLKKLDIQCCFPLWKRNTRELIEEFISLGFRAIVTCVNADLLNKSFVGREINLSFLDDLPKNVDPCGENGEFHSFCFAGPIFSKAIRFSIGDKVYKEYKNPGDEKSPAGFWFCDLLPVIS